MEGFVPEAKYQKLASEYSKLRAQASVLKKAVLDEQSKSAQLRDQLRQRETSIRKSEQEIDSLGFRNKQLEYRVASLQDELAQLEQRRKDKDVKKSSGHNKDVQQVTFVGGSAAGDMAQDALIFEELQKKIMENAKLTTMLDDKELNIQLHIQRMRNMEQLIEKRNAEQNDLEKRLRKDLDLLQFRNQELETKLVEAASMLGSEDALSATGSDNTPLHSHHLQQNHNIQQQTSGERLNKLEKEVAYWRSQCEISKYFDESFRNQDELRSNNTNIMPTLTSSADCSCTSTAAGLKITASHAEGKNTRDSLKEPPIPPTKEQLLFNNLCKKYEDILREKHIAESRVLSVECEVNNLQNCLENATHELKAKDEQMDSINQALQLLEEDLTTTRVNYEEQISVLTEQVISLSEQLAASK